MTCPCFIKVENEVQRLVNSSPEVTQQRVVIPESEPVLFGSTPHLKLPACPERSLWDEQAAESVGVRI